VKFTPRSLFPNCRQKLSDPDAGLPLFLPPDSINQVVRLIHRILMPALVGTGLLTAGSWFASQFWLLELLTHFRLQFAAGALAMMLCAAGLHRTRIAFVSLLLFAANAWPLLPYLVPGAIEARASEPSVRIMFANVRLVNENHAAVLDSVEGEQPDIVGFAEVDATWLQALSRLHDQYPYSVLHPEAGAHGLALFSRIPIRERETSPYLEGGAQTAIIVDIIPASVTLYLAHPQSPVSPLRSTLRNLQLEGLSRMIEADPNREQVLIGDLNTTPWSPNYVSLEREAKLSNAAIGRGYIPTWPSWKLSARLLMIPIDHCLVSPGLTVQGFRVGKGIESDHLPLIVDVAMPTMGIGPVGHDVG
jgi:endonuclease/exonuclease/phosphatase (EEP) superfamily protein YafD